MSMWSGIAALVAAVRRSRYAEMTLQLVKYITRSVQAICL